MDRLHTDLSSLDRSYPRPLISGPFIHGPYNLDRSYTDLSSLDRSILGTVHTQTVFLWVVHTHTVHIWVVRYSGSFIPRQFISGSFVPGTFISGSFVHGALRMTRPHSHGNTCSPKYWSARKLGVHSGAQALHPRLGSLGVPHP